jgi:hypothetical protein
LCSCENVSHHHKITNHLSRTMLVFRVSYHRISGRAIAIAKTLSLK